MNQPTTWEEIERLAAQLDVSVEDAGEGCICLVKRDIQGLFVESKAGLANAITWLAQLQRILALAESEEVTMPESQEEYALNEQLYGELFPHSDFKRKERILYHAFDGSTRSGEIVWVQGPGVTVSKTGKRLAFKARYVVNPDEDTGMPDFVRLGDVIDRA